MISPGPRTAAPVEPEKARAALRTALDAWKAGRPIESLAGESPPIVAQDFDWMAGGRLVEYQVLGDGTAEDANLRVRVELTVRNPHGRTSTKTVAYIVGTDRDVICRDIREALEELLHYRLGSIPLVLELRLPLLEPGDGRLFFISLLPLARLHQGSDLLALGVAALIYCIRLTDHSAALIVYLGKTVQNFSRKVPVGHCLPNGVHIFSYKS